MEDNIVMIEIMEEDIIDIMIKGIEVEVKVIIKIEVEAGVEIVDIINCLCFIFWERDENIYNQI